MRRLDWTFASLLLGLLILSAAPAAAQKSGGTLRIYHWDSPPSMSIHEEVTISTNVPMMGVFNNLVLYDQHVVRPSLQDRKSTRLNSSHANISYAVFCLKKKKRRKSHTKRIRERTQLAK